MIRTLFILIGLVLGLAAAALFAGRMAHLRAVEALELPAFTDGITDDSGALAGRWEGAELTPVTALSWQATGANLDGLHYAVTAESPGGALAGRLSVPLQFSPFSLMLREQALDLGALFQAPPTTGFSGFLRIEALSADIVMPGAALQGIEGNGTLTGLTVFGAELGDAPVLVSSPEAGNWQTEIALDGPLLGTLRLSGAASDPMFRIQGTLTETAALPSDLRAFLDGLGPDSGPWTVDVQLPGSLIRAGL